MIMFLSFTDVESTTEMPARGTLVAESNRQWGVALKDSGWKIGWTMWEVRLWYAISVWYV